MVGASRGGFFVRLFTAMHPADVVGLVLVDPSSEDRLFTMFNGKAVTIASLTAEQYRSIQPTAPVPIAPRPPQTGAPFDRLPPPLYDTRVAIDRRLIASMPPTVPPEVVIEYGESDRAMQAAFAEARASQQHPLGGRPLVVLTRGLDSTQPVIDDPRGAAGCRREKPAAVNGGCGGNGSTRRNGESETGISKTLLLRFSVLIRCLRPSPPFAHRATGAT
jgi:pimeloyl-ACP methyl ester carboxylesterase